MYDRPTGGPQSLRCGPGRNTIYARSARAMSQIRLGPHKPRPSLLFPRWQTFPEVRPTRLGTGPLAVENDLPEMRPSSAHHTRDFEANRSLRILRFPPRPLLLGLVPPWTGSLLALPEHQLARPPHQPTEGGSRTWTSYEESASNSKTFQGTR